MTAPVLLVPGIGNSGPQHWQSRWEARDRRFVRVEQDDWDTPACPDWVRRIEAQVRQTGPEVVLVAHSLGCLAVAHWAAGPHSPVRAVMLVAVPDPAGASFPQQATGFSPLPATRLPFPSMLVSSRDDPYTRPEHSADCARHWGSTLVDVGAAGHINAASGLGDWEEGLALLAELCAQAHAAG